MANREQVQYKELNNRDVLRSLDGLCEIIKTNIREYRGLEAIKNNPNTYPTKLPRLGTLDAAETNDLNTLKSKMGDNQIITVADINKVITYANSILPYATTLIGTTSTLNDPFDNYSTELTTSFTIPKKNSVGYIQFRNLENIHYTQRNISHTFKLYTGSLLIEDPVTSTNKGYTFDVKLTVVAKTLVNTYTVLSEPYVMTAKKEGVAIDLTNITFQGLILSENSYFPSLKVELYNFVGVDTPLVGGDVNIEAGLTRTVVAPTVLKLSNCILNNNGKYTYNNYIPQYIQPTVITTTVANVNTSGTGNFGSFNFNKKENGKYSVTVNLNNVTFYSKPSSTSIGSIIGSGTVSVQTANCGVKLICGSYVATITSANIVTYVKGGKTVSLAASHTYNLPDNTSAVDVMNSYIQVYSGHANISCTNINFNTVLKETLPLTESVPRETVLVTNTATSQVQGGKICLSSFKKNANTKYKIKIKITSLGVYMNPVEGKTGVITEDGFYVYTTRQGDANVYLRLYIGSEVIALAHSGFHTTSSGGNIAGDFEYIIPNNTTAIDIMNCYLALDGTVTARYGAWNDITTKSQPVVLKNLNISTYVVDEAVSSGDISRMLFPVDPVYLEATISKYNFDKLFFNMRAVSAAFDVMNSKWYNNLCNIGCQSACQNSCMFACQNCHNGTCHDQNCGGWS